MPEWLDHKIEGERAESFAMLLKECICRHPEQRVGQIIINAILQYEGVKPGGTRDPNIFYTEDDILRKALLAYSRALIE